MLSKISTSTSSYTDMTPASFSSSDDSSRSSISSKRATQAYQRVIDKKMAERKVSAKRRSTTAAKRVILPSISKHRSLPHKSSTPDLTLQALLHSTNISYRQCLASIESMKKQHAKLQANLHHLKQLPRRSRPKNFDKQYSSWTCQVATLEQAINGRGEQAKQLQDKLKKITAEIEQQSTAETLQREQGFLRQEQTEHDALKRKQRESITATRAQSSSVLTAKQELRNAQDQAQALKLERQDLLERLSHKEATLLQLKDEFRQALATRTTQYSERAEHQHEELISELRNELGVTGHLLAQNQTQLQQARKQLAQQQSKLINVQQELSELKKHKQQEAVSSQAASHTIKERLLRASNNVKALRQQQQNDQNKIAQLTQQLSSERLQAAANRQKLRSKSSIASERSTRTQTEQTARRRARHAHKSDAFKPETFFQSLISMLAPVVLQAIKGLTSLFSEWMHNEENDRRSSSSSSSSSSI